MQPAGPITTKNEVVQPTSTFNGAGQLLQQGDCKSTSYTLVSAGDMVYYAAFIGCNADRPECCPWSVSVEGVGGAAAAAPTGPGGSGREGNRIAGGAGNFPIPADGGGYLSRCPDDYYSVSGQCCPNGFYKFTTHMAYQTPCFSSLATRITPPPLTAGLANNPTDTSLPTSAVVNVAWAMGYNVTTEAQSPLSRGAIVGIGVGAGVLALLLGAVTVFVFLRVRRNRKRALEEQHQHQQATETGYTTGAPPTVVMASPLPPPQPAMPEMGDYHDVKQHSTVGTVAAAHWNQGQDEYGHPLPPQQQQQYQPDYQQQYQQQQYSGYDAQYRK